MRASLLRWYERSARPLPWRRRTRDLGGRWPTDVAGWLRLPGVGHYTAAAAAGGDPTRFPAPRRRSTVQPLTLHAWWVTRADADGTDYLALERRPQDGLWGGLHGPPWRAEAPDVGTRVAAFRHLLTHRRIDAVVWRTPRPPADAAVGWYRRDDVLALGQARIDRRALACLTEHGAVG